MLVSSKYSRPRHFTSRGLVFLSNVFCRSQYSCYLQPQPLQQHVDAVSNRGFHIMAAANEDRIDDLEKLYVTGKSAGPLPRNVWVAMCRSYCRHSRTAAPDKIIQKLQRVVGDMRAVGHTPDAATYATLLEWSASRGEVGNVLALLEEVEAAGLESSRTLVPSPQYGSLLSALPQQQQSIPAPLLSALSHCLGLLEVEVHRHRAQRDCNDGASQQPLGAALDSLFDVAVARYGLTAELGCRLVSYYSALGNTTKAFIAVKAALDRCYNGRIFADVLPLVSTALAVFAAQKNREALIGLCGLVATPVLGCAPGDVLGALSQQSRFHKESPTETAGSSQFLSFVSSPIFARLVRYCVAIGACETAASALAELDNIVTGTKSHPFPLVVHQLLLKHLLATTMQATSMDRVARLLSVMDSIGDGASAGSSGQRPSNLVSYNILLRHCVRHHLTSELSQIRLEMRSAGHTPDAATHAALLELYASCDDHAHLTVQLRAAKGYFLNLGSSICGVLSSYVAIGDVNTVRFVCELLGVVPTSQMTQVGAMCVQHGVTVAEDSREAISIALWADIYAMSMEMGIDDLAALVLPKLTMKSRAGVPITPRSLKPHRSTNEPPMGELGADLDFLGSTAVVSATAEYDQNGSILPSTLEALVVPLIQSNDFDSITDVATTLADPATAAAWTPEAYAFRTWPQTLQNCVVSIDHPPSVAFLSRARSAEFNEALWQHRVANDATALETTWCRMLEEGVHPDEQTFFHIFKSALDRHDWHCMDHFHSVMDSLAVNPSLELHALLLSGYAQRTLEPVISSYKERLGELALCVPSDHRTPYVASPILHNCLIQHYLKHRKMNEVEPLFADMQHRGIPLDVLSLKLLLQFTQLGAVPFHRLEDVLRPYQYAGFRPSALLEISVLDIADKKSPTTFNFDESLRFYATLPFVSEFQRVVGDMRAVGHTPDAATYATLLEWSASRGEVDNVLALLEEVEAAGLEMPFSASMLTSAMLYTSGYASLAKKLLRSATSTLETASP